MSSLELPPSLAAVLRPELGAIGAEVAAAVGQDFDPQTLRLGVEEALRMFVDEIELGRKPRQRRIFANFGRTEVRAGRPLEALLGAYRLGGRIAWRRFAAAGRAAEVDPDVLHVLAEAIFAWIDDLSDQSAAGYAQESRVVASAARARRERLVRLLVADPPAGAAEIEAAAAQAPWTLPARLACVAVSRHAAPPGPDVLAAPLGDLVCLVVPERAVGALDAGSAGPVVAWRDAGRSWARARTAHALGLRRAEDHLELLLLAAAPVLAAELRAQALAPLAGLTPGQRERAEETLRAWLDHDGALRQTAENLGIHPQTVRYRVARLRERFGPALDDADSRLRLALALRVDGSKVRG